MNQAKSSAAAVSKRAAQAFPAAGEGRPKFSVVIPVYNALSSIRDCLESLAAAMQVFPNTELIVVDNGSTDGTYEWLVSHWGDRARVLKVPDVTISTLRNYGARLAKGEYLCFIDSDCVVTPNYFVSAAEVLDTKGVSVTGSRHVLPGNACWIERAWYRLHAEANDGIVSYLPSGNLIVRRDAFFQTGGFNESLITGEDVDLCRRLTGEGTQVYQAHAVAAIHLGNPKSVRGFFRREVWHGIGMFQEASSARVSKMLLLTLTHLVLTLTAFPLAVLGPGSLATRLGVFFACVLFAPALAVAYRWSKQRAISNPLQSFFLYAVYLTARSISLLRLIAAKLRGIHRPQKLWYRA